MERRKGLDEKAGQLEAREREYIRELYALSKKYLEVEKERPLYSIMQRTFGTDPFALQDSQMYKRGGYRQSKRKQEFARLGRQVAIERGLP
ncbi:MAG: hypothetical protein QW687_06430, partial [Candidatus Hadarchaeales archaeon]